MNLYNQVSNFTSSELGEGLILTLLCDDEADFSNAEIKIYSSNSTPEQPNVGSHNIHSWASLPSEIRSKYLADAANAKVVFTVYKTPLLFTSRTLLEQSTMDEAIDDVNRTVITPVVALSVGDREIRNLEESIRLTFHSLIVIIDNIYQPLLLTRYTFHCGISLLDTDKARLSPLYIADILGAYVQTWKMHESYTSG